ncbi:MAG: hypothetical protein JSW00_07075 [Thermoplasmata archaeon]|jgi:hypothetical protein|nr:MAG: hypothetical protein JSW00_07075 [Thermoplasmata archaeon]
MKRQILKILFVMLVVLLGTVSVADASIQGGLTQLRELTAPYLGQIRHFVETINMQIRRYVEKIDIQLVTVALSIPILIMIFVFFLRRATRWTVDFEIDGWTACKMLIIFSVIGYVNPIALDLLLSALTKITAGLLLLSTILLLCITDFFAGSAICAIVIKDPETNSRIGFIKGILVFFYLMLIAFALGITIAFLLSIAMLMELSLAIVSWFLIAVLYLGFGIYVLPIAIRKASDWWAFLSGAQLLIGTFGIIFGASWMSS